MALPVAHLTKGRWFEAIVGEGKLELQADPFLRRIFFLLLMEVVDNNGYRAPNRNFLKAFGPELFLSKPRNRFVMRDRRMILTSKSQLNLVHKCLNGGKVMLDPRFNCKLTPRKLRIEEDSNQREGG